MIGWQALPQIGLGVQSGGIDDWGEGPRANWCCWGPPRVGLAQRVGHRRLSHGPAPDWGGEG